MKDFLYLLATFIFTPSVAMGQTEAPPIGIAVLMDIAKSVQGLDDMVNVVTVARIIDDEIQHLDMTRLSASDTEWTYGKNMALTTFEDTGIYFYDFLDKDAYAITVTAYNSVTAEITFKHKEWLRQYIEQARSLGFVLPQYAEGPGKRMLQCGGLDDIMFEINDEEQIYTVVYCANYYSEPLLMTSADAVTFFFKTIGDVHEMLEGKGYELQQAMPNDNQSVEIYVKGCRCDIDAVGNIAVTSTGEPTDLCSAVVLTRSTDSLVDVKLANLNSFEEEFVDGLIRTGLLPIDNSHETDGSVYPKSFVSQSGIHAVIANDQNLWTVSIGR